MHQVYAFGSLNLHNKQEIITENKELLDNKGEKISYRVAGDVLKSKKVHRRSFNMIHHNHL